MNSDIHHVNLPINSSTKDQIHACLTLLKEMFGRDLLAVYLYGSSVFGGLQKFSDIDLFVVITRATTPDEKLKLAHALMELSGIYMKNEKLPIEMTIVEKSAINPWRYPPKFDFQYGEWLREQFANGISEPWNTKEMPDLAILITQILLANISLTGTLAGQLLPTVPYKDFMAATIDALPHLKMDIESDTRNVLLTLARIWSTVATDTIRPKPSAADWAINHLPEKLQPVMERAKAICTGKEKEKWDDLRELIMPCAEWMLSEINKEISTLMHSVDPDRSIRIA